MNYKENYTAEEAEKLMTAAIILGASFGHIVTQMFYGTFLPFGIVPAVLSFGYILKKVEKTDTQTK